MGPPRGEENHSVYQSFLS